MFPTFRPCAPLFLINVLVLTLISCPPIYIYLHVPQFFTPPGYIFCCTPLYIQCTTLFIQCTTHFIQCTTLLLNKYTTLLYHTKVNISMYHTPMPPPFTLQLQFFYTFIGSRESLDLFCATRLCPTGARILWCHTLYSICAMILIMCHTFLTLCSAFICPMFLK